MAQIDNIIAKMEEKQVEHILFQSGQPSQVYRGEERTAGPALTAAQLQQLVQEVAPAHLGAQLQQPGRVQFLHQAPQGLFDVVYERDAEGLQVSLARSVLGGAANPRGVPAQPVAPIQQTLTQPAPPVSTQRASIAQMGSGQCPDCGATNAYSHLACTDCGAPLPWAAALEDEDSVGPVSSTNSTAQLSPSLPASYGTFNPTLLRTFRIDSQARSVAFSPDGKLLATGGFDSQVKLWDLASGQLRHTLKHGGITDIGGVTSLCFSPDGRSLASCSNHKGKVWNLLSYALRWSDGSGTGGLSAGLAVAGAPDGQALAWANFRGIVQFRDWQDGKVKQATHKSFLMKADAMTDRPNGSFIHLAYAPDGKTLATAINRKLTLWDPASGERLALWGNSEGGFLAIVQGLAYAPDGKTIAWCHISTGESKVILWNAQTGRQTPLRTSGNAVSTVAFSPDGRFLATGSGDGDVRLYAMPRGELVRTLKGHESSVWRVAYSPDGRLLASASLDKTVRLWRMK